MQLFYSVSELLSECKRQNVPLWLLTERESAKERGISAQQCRAMMARRLQAMREADKSYDCNQRSVSGLSGGDGAKMERYLQSGASVSDGFIGDVIAAALRMGECNACMHRIVAAPTAGSCGVIPSVLLSCEKHFSCSDDELINALFVTAAFGAVIATRASISGAEAGCQAEIGTASAMAAAALVYLRGGSEEMMAHAAAMSLKNMMGLVCDPVAGLVEVPCVKRNVGGAVIAISSAEMALAGIESRIPADQVIDAMAQVGEMLPSALRETGRGGIAASPAGEEIRKRFFNT